MASSDRPAHPDFTVLAAAVRRNDKRAESGKTMEQIVSEVADPDSVTYVAIQRAIRVPDSTPRNVAFSAAWTDGMLAGYELAMVHLRDSMAPDGSRRTGG